MSQTTSERYDVTQHAQASIRMNFPFWPIFSFVRAILEGGGVSPTHVFRIFPWMLKLVLLEPPRLIEQLLFDRRIRYHHLVQDPVFILGHFRSGTTFLQEILCHDPRFGYLNWYHMIFPEITLVSEKYLKRLFTLIATHLQIQFEVHQVPASFDFPGEDDFAMLMLCMPESTYLNGLFPNHFRRYFNDFSRFEDASTLNANLWSMQYEYLVRKISFANGGRRLILKSPPNTGRLAVLRKMFPNARYIYIHRNPYDVYGSCKKLWKINSRYSLRKASDAEIRELILYNYEHLLANYLNQRETLEDSELFEIRYEDFVREPMECLKRMYDALDLGGFSDAAPKFLNCIEERRRTRSSNYTLTAEEVEMLRARWAFSFKAWPYPEPPDNTRKIVETGEPPT